MSLPIFRFAVALAVTAVTLALASCGIGTYPREFGRASAVLPRPPLNAQGPWEGKWESKVNGHHGPLWCLVDPTPDLPGHYNFRYRAGWGALRFGDYTHTIPARLAADGSLELTGEMVLPGGFGTYQVKGRLTREAFDATYQSEADHGTMRLRRPAPPGNGQGQ